MKKLITFAMLFLFFVPILKAQESTFNKGDNVINVGIGLGSLYGTGTLYSTKVPPVSVSFERGFFDGILDKGVIGIGAFLGYTSYEYRSSFLGTDYGWKYSNIIIGARGTFHYPLVDKLDTYAGLFVGFNVNSTSEIGNPGNIDPSSPSSLAHSEFVGVRYYFTDNISAFAELGYGISYLTLGAAFKF